MSKKHLWSIYLRFVLAALFAIQGLIFVDRPAYAAGRCYVNHAAVGANTGASWTDAYLSLQSALSAGCSEIWVARGLYTPTTVIAPNVPTTTDRNVSFQIPGGVALYGGFKGEETETMLTQRDPAVNLTILSGDIDHNDSQTPVITDLKTVSGNSTNSYSVVTLTSGTVTLDGFIITGGYGGNGGGVTSTTAAATLYGQNLSLIGNTGGARGGGLYAYADTIYLKNCRIQNNAALNGGGIQARGNSLLHLENVLISGNRITKTTGVSGFGGGIDLDYSGNETLELTNVTLVDNAATGTNVNYSWGPGIRAWDGDTVVMRNSIAWGHQDKPFWYDYGSWQLSYNLIQGGGCTSSDPAKCVNTNTLSSDPLFVGASGWASAPSSGGDYHLQRISPAIDAGDNSYVTLSIGLDGLPRLADLTTVADTGAGTAPIVDLGVYEEPEVGRIMFVTTDGKASGECQHWSESCTLTYALSHATVGKEIWVKEGVHVPTTVTTDRSATFQLVEEVPVYGGFAGTEYLRSNRNPSAHPTILSGDIDGNDLTDVDGNTSNTYQVVSGAQGTVLDGFTITGGYADSPTMSSGAAITAAHGAMTLGNLIITGNYASGPGGGLYLSDMTIMVTNITITGNQAGGSGGAIAVLAGSVLTVTNATMSGNSVGGSGGALSAQDGSVLTITGAEMNSNTASGSGGAFSLEGGSTLALTNAKLNSNTAGVDGGAIASQEGSTLNFLTITMSGNQAAGSGGAANLADSSVVLVNGLVTGNQAATGGAIHAQNGSLSLTNVTLSGNAGGGLFSSAALAVRNSILWANGDTNISLSGGAADFNYSLFEDGCPSGGTCTNILTSDPLFFTPVLPADAPTTSGDFHLQAASPAIDAGDNEVIDPSLPSTDIAGDPRKRDTVLLADTGNGTAPIVDMGAYEAPAYVSTGPVRLAKQGGLTSGECLSWSTACELYYALNKAGNGDEIWVAQGVYLPTSDTSDRGTSFTLKPYVGLYGGFTGDEVSRSQRVVDPNLTILSGDIQKDDDQYPVVTDLSTVTGNTNNSYHVLWGKNANYTVLDGFTVSGAYGPYAGAGLYFIDEYGAIYGHLTLRNMRFVGNRNTGDYGGGGIYAWNTYLTVENVTFEGNWAAQSGGGLYMTSNRGPAQLTNVTFANNRAYHAGGVFEDCGVGGSTYSHVIFSGNVATDIGGGMYAFNTSPTLTDVTFENNSAMMGGGLAFSSFGHITMNRVIFSGNTAISSNDDYAARGGGMILMHAGATMSNVTFAGNLADAPGYALGGALWVYNPDPSIVTGNIVLTNVLVSGNKTLMRNPISNYTKAMSSAILLDQIVNTSNKVVMTNVTFNGNMGIDSTSTPLFVKASSLDLYNSIIYGNSGTNQVGWMSSNVVASNNLIQDGCTVMPSGYEAYFTCTNLVTGDPLFVTPVDPAAAPTTAGNLRLAYPSPAIETGTNTGCPTTDLDGLPRPNDGNADGTATCDMGAYEAGDMVCGVSEGGVYTFPNQSGVSIEVTTLGPNLACLYVDEMEVDHQNATSGIKTGRYWLLRGLQSDKITAADGFVVTLILPANDTPDIKDKVCRYTGIGQEWDCAQDSFDAASKTITRAGVTAFSDWAVGEDVSPLVVSLQALSARSVSPLPVVGIMGLLGVFMLSEAIIRHHRRK